MQRLRILLPLTVLLLAACGDTTPSAFGPGVTSPSVSAVAQSPCQQNAQSDPTVTDPGQPDKFDDGASAQATTTADGLKYVDLTVGTGAVVKAGDCVTMQYTGWLAAGGTPFDSSRTRQGGFPTVIPGQLIQGWNEGIPGMALGGRRRLMIPSALGYGAQGSSPAIPANADLVFLVEVVRIYPGG